MTLLYKDLVANSLAHCSEHCYSKKAAYFIGPQLIRNPHRKID